LYKINRFDIGSIYVLLFTKKPYLSTMAIVEGNIIMRGAHGTFAGQVVYRQRYGKTIMCKLPKPYPPKTPTQIANQERFKRANDFAKQAMKDPEKKAYYKSIAKPGRTAYHAAFKDAYNKPKVEVIKEEKKLTVKIKAKHRVYMVKASNLAGKGNGICHTARGILGIYITK